MIISMLSACKDDADPNDNDDPGTDEDFTGSISGSEGVEPPAPTPPPIAEGDPNAVIEISTPDQLKAIAQNGTYILKNDIDMSGTEFSPIGNYAYPFKGTLKSADGECYSIKNLKITVTEAAAGPSPTSTYLYAGLFGATNGATVERVNITDADISASSSDEYCYVTAGSLAGYMINTSVRNCSLSGNVYAKSKLYNAYAGGFCGILEDGSISASSSITAVQTDDSKNRAVSGGIAGLALLSPEVSGCVIEGSVKAVSSYGISYAGGLVGNTRLASYTACRVNADIYAETVEFSSKEPKAGAAYAGGLVAVSSATNEKVKTSFTRCYSLDKTVTAVGNNCPAYAGGIAAYIAYTDMTHCYSMANVTLKGISRLSYASAGFGKISTVAGDSSAQDYVADFSIKGCFVYGSLTVEHSDLPYMLVGTLYAHITSEGSKASIRSSYYNQNASFTVNDTKDHKIITKNGTARTSSYFTLEHTADFGWNASEWETVGGYLYAKI